MKHVFLLLTVSVLSIFSSNAQSIEVINKQVTNDRALVNTLRDNLSSRGGGQATCGPDTLIYALAKATGLNIVNINNATSVFAVSQYFDAPQDITINGASFYGFKTDANGGITSDISVSVYLAGADSLPSGATLTTGIVSVDTAFGGGALSVLVKHANFTPVTVSQPYCVVVENDSPNPIGMVASDYTVGDGQGEWLASANLFGDWLHGYDLVLGPDQFDADALIEPHVEYTLEASFDQTGLCIGATGGDGTWENNSSPILNNRMYSVAAFLGTPELQYSWDYGDGSAITNTVNGANTYSGNSPWTVTLTDTLFGWTIVCVDDFIQDAETVEAGTLTALTNPACFNAGSADISAAEDAAPVVPAGYEVVYVLTDADNNLEIIDAQATPNFTVTAVGNYIIHTLVYDPNTLTPSTLLGVPALDANALLVQGGGSICAALDLAGAPITVEGPEAGTLTQVTDPVCFDAGSAIFSTTQDAAPVVPAGYEVLYVLTDADNNLEIIDAQATPSFTVTSGGNYIIHTLVYDPNTLTPGDLLGVEALVANSLLVQGGGSICAALDLAGAPVTVEAPEAGTLTAISPVCLFNISTTISATEVDAPSVPTGYEVLYVLTDANNNLEILDAQPTPNFTVTAVGDYIIHTLVYDPNTLTPGDLLGVEALTANSLLVQGGGTICAALDLTGAPVTVENCPCDATAGTLDAVQASVCVGGQIEAVENTPPFVPAGYEVLYVLTDADNNLTVLNASSTPSFDADSVGNYIIHTLVYDPNTLTPSDAIGLEAAVANGLLVQGGGTICAALDLTGATVAVSGPSSGTLVGGGNVCLGSTMTAAHGTLPDAPTGYEILYVLTDADNNLTVIDAAATPSFDADSLGTFIIHTLVYDPNVLTPGDLIGVEALTANSLLVQGGGSICAALDLTGASFNVVGPEAGTLTAGQSPVCIGETIEATVSTAPNVPAGYEVLYVLTDADNNLTVVDAAATPSFTATAEGNFIIHTLVYDPATLTPTDLIGVEALVANSLLVQGGGAICAALDLAGATVEVEACACDATAGTLVATESVVCTGGTMSATVGQAPIVPPGFEVLYVLTDADNNLTVVDAASTPLFDATTPGNFIIHTLVYDPATLDPTTAIGLPAATVSGLLVQGGGSICAALDLTGAPIQVAGPMAGTLTADADVVCIDNGIADISASTADAPEVPTGFAVFYVLTDADDNLTVLNVSPNSEFTVNNGGNYIIHTLVYNPEELNPADIVGAEAALVNTLLVQGGGFVCAALDLVGAPILVEAPEAGSLVADDAIVCLENGSADISATQGNAPDVPSGYEVIYVLTDADDNLTIVDANGTPEFTLTEEGNYIIHTLVYDPAVLTPADLLGEEALTANGLLVQGGGSVCAALDLNGAAITVSSCTSIQETLNAAFNVYPNPNDGQFVIEVSGFDLDAQVNVMDATGRLVYSEAAVMNSNFRKELNLDVVPGTYLLQIVTTDAVVVRKLQVQ